MPESKAAGRSQHKPIAHAFAHRSQKPAANGFGLGEVAETKVKLKKKMFKIMNKVSLKEETAILPNPCYVQCGDNLELLKSQPNESVNMIYCDILYGTGRNFADYQDLKPIRSEIESHYLPRLIEMKRVLKQNGVIVLQMDYNISHWIRIIMDDIFGFIKNEIIWDYEKFCGKTTSLKNNHDSILVYSKGKDYTFNKLFYQKEKPKKQTVRVWDSIQKKAVQKKDENGKLMYYTQTDASLDDVWTDIPNINPMAKERIAYSTQKPIELIKRILLIYSNEGDVVADYYLGSGTTAKVCQELNRNFIGCDLNPKAIEITKARLNGGQ